MTIEYGLLLLFLGMITTVIFFIIILNTMKDNVEKKSQNVKGPLYDLRKYLPGWKGDDCE
jgi:hypothetical protein